MLKLSLLGIVLISCLALTTCLPPAAQEEPSNLPPAVQYEIPPSSAQLNEEAVVGYAQSMAAEEKKKRYTNVSKWKNEGTLTYRIFNYPNCTILSNDKVDAVIAKAISKWDDVDTTMTVTKIDSGTPNINISWGAFSHCDKYPFDGPSKILGHGFYPGTGSLHFDDSECWGDGTGGTKLLLYVAVHEFGHIFGLGHSNVTDAIMYPYYNTNNPDCDLKPDDIDGILSLHPTA